MVKIHRGGPAMYYGASKLIRDRAKELRKNLSPEEKLLWKHLSEKKLGARFRQQHPIHTYTVDFFCPALKLAIEIDGRIHEKFENQNYDKERDSILSDFGIVVLRFTNKEVHSDIESVIHRIQWVIDQISA